jgi:hypothetical protein
MHRKNIPMGIFSLVTAWTEGDFMAALLERIEDLKLDEVRPCVASLACWWKEVQELEGRLGYSRSSLAARAAWDELLASEILIPHQALYLELRTCVAVWARISAGQPIVIPSLLDRLAWVALADNLPLPQFGVLAAFRLRQRLCGVRRGISDERA